MCAPGGAGRRRRPQAARAKAAPAGPHTHSPPSRPQTESRALVANFGEVGERGEEEKKGGGGSVLGAPVLPLVPAQEQKLTPELIVLLLLRLSLSAASQRRDKSDYPRSGLAGSLRPALPRTVEKLGKELELA